MSTYETEKPSAHMKNTEIKDSVKYLSEWEFEYLWCWWFRKQLCIASSRLKSIN